MKMDLGLNAKCETVRDKKTSKYSRLAYFLLVNKEITTQYIFVKVRPDLFDNVSTHREVSVA